MTLAREYETICVYQPDVQGDALKSIEDKMQKILSKHNVGEVSKKDWGNRTLAYPINNFKTAHYIQYIYTAETDAISELEKNLGYEETVLRYLTVKIENETQKKVAVEPSGFDSREQFKS